MGNYHIYLEAERRLQSITAKTNFYVVTAQACFKFHRMNSIYVSHRHCDVEQGHGVRGLVILHGNKPIFVTHQITLEGDVTETVYIPISKLPQLPYPADYPTEMKNAILVGVSLPDEFEGFDEYGTPSFNKQATVYYDGCTVYPFHFQQPIPE